MFPTRAFLPLLLSLAACSSDTSTADQVSLSLSFEGLPNLGPDYEYEAWLVGDDGPVSAGRFNVADDGSHTSLFEVAVEGAFKMHLTIEAVDDASSEWSMSHILYGEFINGVAELRIDGPPALANDFSGSEGSFVLATPTAPDAPDEQGVWFLDPSGEMPAPSLNLPRLPEGWTYEGWVVGPDGPVSTGTFRMEDEADSDGAGPGAGPGDAPPFPGQDFITPARDLSQDHQVVISIEPVPDNSPDPFQLKPLAAPIGTDTAPTLQVLGNVIGENTIRGMAVLN